MAHPTAAELRGITIKNSRDEEMKRAPKIWMIIAMLSICLLSNSAQAASYDTEIIEIDGSILKVFIFGAFTEKNMEDEAAIYYSAGYRGVEFYDIDNDHVASYWEGKIQFKDSSQILYKEKETATTYIPQLTPEEKAEKEEQRAKEVALFKEVWSYITKILALILSGTFIIILFTNHKYIFEFVISPQLEKSKLSRKIIKMDSNTSIKERMKTAILVDERYAELKKEYKALPPAERKTFLAKLSKERQDSNKEKQTQMRRYKDLSYSERRDFDKKEVIERRKTKEKFRSLSPEDREAFILKIAEDSLIHKRSE